MGGFIFILIFIFVIIPIFKNIIGGKSTKKPTAKSNAGSGQKNWAEVQKLLQQKIQDQASGQISGKRDAHGHTDARKQARNRLRAGGGSTNVFPETHQARVRKRDQRARSERNRIEAMLHSKNNRSIVRVGNKSMDAWGKRGDSPSGGGGWLFLLLFGLIAVLVLSKIAPDLWQNLSSEIMRVINN